MASWRDKYKEMELAFHSAKNDYAEVARALGFKDQDWFGDPIVRHAEVVAKAKELAEEVFRQ